jgi:hypothetical protein
MEVESTQSFLRGVQQNHEDSGSLIMLAHSAITQMHNRYAVGASTWLIILPKHFACMWCSAFGDLTNLHYHGKGLYQVEVVLPEKWLGKGGCDEQPGYKCRRLSLDPSVLCPCVGCCNCRIFCYLRKGRIKLITQKGLDSPQSRIFKLCFRRHETPVLEKKLDEILENSLR